MRGELTVAETLQRCVTLQRSDTARGVVLPHYQVTSAGGGYNQTTHAMQHDSYTCWVHLHQSGYNQTTHATQHDRYTCWVHLHQSGYNQTQCNMIDTHAGSIYIKVATITQHAQRNMINTHAGSIYIKKIYIVRSKSRENKTSK